MRLGKVNTLFIAHHYRTTDRRHRGYIGAFFQHTHDDPLLERRQPLCQRMIAG